jgi:hypothetical protein
MGKKLEILGELSALEIETIIENRLKSLGSKTDKEYFKKFMNELVANKCLPPQLLNDIPVKSDISGKTRFDQLYDATMLLSYPEYSESVQTHLSEPPDPDMKVWKAMFDRKYKVSSVLLKARSYQEAFGLAIDYLCRISLRLYQVAPLDATVRVAYCSEKFLRRYFAIRISSKQNRRALHNTKAKSFTPRQVNGARMAALGFPPSDGRRSIVKYSEYKDMLRMQKKGVNKTSAVLGESFKREE